MTRLPSKMEKDTWVMNIRKIGMWPVSRVSSSTHGADIRKVSTRDAVTHVRKYPGDPKGGPATTLLYFHQQHCCVSLNNPNQQII